MNGNLDTWSESSNEQATFSDITEITKEILKISLKFAKIGFYLWRSKGLWRETALFSGFASRQWFKNVLDVEVGEIMSIILLIRDCCFNQTRTNLGAERCARTVTPNEVDENQDTCAVSSNYWWQFFLVARLIKDKADASSTPFDFRNPSLNQLQGECPNMENVTRHVVLNFRVSIHAWRGSTVRLLSLFPALLRTEILLEWG